MRAPRLKIQGSHCRRERDNWQLSNASLLETDAQGDVRLHRLLAAFVTSLGLADDVLVAVEQAVGNEASRINASGLPRPLLAWRAHLSWLAVAAEARQSENAAWLWNEFGYHLRMTGDYAGARAAYERALRILEQTLGPDHPNTQTVRHSLQSLPGD